LTSQLRCTSAKASGAFLPDVNPLQMAIIHKKAFHLVAMLIAGGNSGSSLRIESTLPKWGNTREAAIRPNSHHRPIVWSRRATSLTHVNFRFLSRPQNRGS
jgi:hypothetical protein